MEIDAPHSFVIISHDSWALNKNFVFFLLLTIWGLRQQVLLLRMLKRDILFYYQPICKQWCCFLCPIDSPYFLNLPGEVLCPFSKDKAQFYLNIQFLLLKLLPLVACAAVYGNWTHCQWTVCSSYSSVRYPLVERQCLHRLYVQYVFCNRTFTNIYFKIRKYRKPGLLCSIFQLCFKKILILWKVFEKNDQGRF